jgi:hypothetical protein
MLSTVNQIRSNVVDNCHWGVANAHLIGYAETRPYPRPAYHARTAFVTDCSGFVSLMAMWSRLANMQGVDIDPSGYAFDGYGNSDTIFDHLPSVELAHTWRGDLVVYGSPGATVHVACLVQGGGKTADPLVVSHGSPAGPQLMTLSGLSSGFGGGVITYKQWIYSGNELPF